MTRRSRGDGSIHYAEDRNRWVGQLDLGRGADGKRIRRKVVGRTKSDVAAKLRALRVENPLAQKIHDGDRWAATAIRLGLPLVANDGIFSCIPGLQVETRRSA